MQDRPLDLEQVKQKGIQALRKLAGIHHLTVNEALDTWMELYDWLVLAAALHEETVTLVSGRLQELEAFYAGKLQGGNPGVHPSGPRRFYQYVLGFVRGMKDQVAQVQRSQGIGQEAVAQFPLSMMLGLGPVVRHNPGF